MKTPNSLKSFLSFFVLCCLVINFTSQFVLSQTQGDTPTPTPTATPIDPELQKLKDRNAILEEQKKAAELEKGINDAKFPKPTTTPLAGDTTIDSGVKIESEMMAYRALRRTAGQIAVEVNGKLAAKTESKVAILNDQWLLGLRDYWGTRNKVRLLNEGYEKVFDQPTPIPIKVPSIPKTGVVGTMYTKPDPRPEVIVATNIAKNQNKKPSKKSFKNESGSVSSLSSDSNQIDINSVKGDDTTASSSTSNSGGFSKFATTVAAVGGAFGMVGNLVGATVDLLALARTDTKITGFTFTPQESALVSEVYKNLKTGSRYYPAEFSPNLNLQNTSIIIGNIQAVGDKRDVSAQLLANIDDTEKVYQQMTAEKETLEAREKQIPLEIKVTNAKIELLNSVTNRLDALNKERNDLIEKLANLNEEKTIGLPKKIGKNSSSIAKLEVKLSSLYSQIEPSAPSGKVINQFIEIAENLDATALPLLGDKDSYTLEDLDGITTGDENAKKQLIAAAETNLSRKLSMQEKATLLEPFDLDRLTVFVKVGKYIRSNPILLSKIEPALFLSDAEQLNLLYWDDADFLIEKSKLAKTRGVKLTKLKSLNAQFDKFYEDIIKTDSLGINPITKQLQTENMMDAFGCSKTDGTCPNAYALVLKVIDVGGNNKVKKNLVTMIATGDDISHSGGAIVEYKLYDLNGKILNSSVCTAYESYKKAKNINSALQNNQGIVVCQTVSTTDAESESGDNEGYSVVGSGNSNKPKTPPVLKEKP